MKSNSIYLLITIIILSQKVGACNPDTILVQLTNACVISWDIKNSEILFKESNGITNLSHKDVLDLILLISDTTIVSKSICTKESPCYKGDIAFLLLAKVGYISISRDLGMQFDAQPRECTIPIGMLEWLEKNRIKIVQQLFDIYREKD